MGSSAVAVETITSNSASSQNGDFFGHPKGLRVLFFTEMWERFSYYGMRALLMLFMVAPLASGGLGFDTPKAASIYGWYTSLAYFFCIFGGIIADRWTGQRYAILIGGIIIASGHLCLAIPNLLTFYAGLGLIIIGTGLLKPNISAIVGGLYAKDDARRDAGFSIFYMGINLGAFVSPLITGYLGQRVDWHYGFAAAGVGMILGLVQHVWGWKHLGDVGLRPASRGKNQEVITHPALTKDEKTRMVAIFFLFLFASIFWGAFEQAGSSLNLFADKNTSNSLLGMSFPSSYHQSTNPLMLILFAPLIAVLWLKLGKRQPSSPFKFAIGLLFVSVSFAILAYASKLSGSGETAVLVSPMWLTVVYFMHTIGELCLSPVGLSAMTKLSPARYVGLMMGIWFLATSVGSKLAGWTAGFFDSMPLPELFGSVFAITGVSAILAFILVKPIKKMMAGVH